MLFLRRYDNWLKNILKHIILSSCGRTHDGEEQDERSSVGTPNTGRKAGHLDQQRDVVLPQLRGSEGQGHGVPISHASVYGATVAHLDQVLPVGSR